MSSNIPGNSVPNTVWSHVTPQNMPWGSGYENYPPVIRFTGNEKVAPVRRSLSQGLHSCTSDKFQFNPKRKGLFSQDTTSPHKKYITEEIMASELQSMHISNRYTTHGKHMRVPIVSNESREGDTFEPEGSADPLPSLVVCDEIRQLQTPSILPPSLLAKLMVERSLPTKALVLWKPPDPIIRMRNIEKAGRNEGTFGNILGAYPSEEDSIGICRVTHHSHNSQSSTDTSTLPSISISSSPELITEGDTEEMSVDI